MIWGDATVRLSALGLVGVLALTTGLGLTGVTGFMDWAVESLSVREEVGEGRSRSISAPKGSGGVRAFRDITAGEGNAVLCMFGRSTSDDIKAGGGDLTGVGNKRGSFRFKKSFLVSPSDSSSSSSESSRILRADAAG